MRVLLCKMRSLLYYISLRVCSFLPLNNKKVVFENFNGKGFSGNSKYVALELLKCNSNCKIVWIVDKDVDLKEFPKSIKTVRSRSISAAFEIETAKYWIDNVRKNGFFKRKKQIYIQLWHGLIGIKMVEGQNEADLSSYYKKIAKKDSQATDIMVAPCKRYENIMKKYFWISPDKVVCLGAPEYDILFKYDEEWKINIKKRLGVSAYKVLLYAPTFRNDPNYNYFEIDFSKVLDSLSLKFGGEWILAIRMHPILKDVDYSNVNCDYINVTDYSDCQELVLASDAVITDYSSVIFNSAIIHIPSFIHAADVEKYKQERNFEIPIESLPFSLSKTNSELINNINNYYSKEANKRYDRFFENLGVLFDGKSSERVVNLLRKDLI